MLLLRLKKARGLKKKISNPIAKKRKEVIDFCYVYHENKSVNLTDFVEKENLHLKYFGLAKIPHIKNSYNLFYNKTLDYKGVAGESANEVCLSSIPKGEKPLGLMYFNLEAYSTYCKEYREYWSWVEKHNMIHKMREAIVDVNYLLSRGFSEKSSLQLVGSRYKLNNRQQKAVRGMSASNIQISQRRNT